MEVLGVLGNIYIFLLLILLIGGIALVAYKISRQSWDKAEGILKGQGGTPMNKWFKLALASFIGILIATFALGLTGASGTSMDQGTMTGSTDHASHHQGGAGSGGTTMSTDTGTGMNMNGMGVDNHAIEMQQMQMNIMYLQQQMNQMMQMHANSQPNGMNMSNGGMNMM